MRRCSDCRWMNVHDYTDYIPREGHVHIFAGYCSLLPHRQYMEAGDQDTFDSYLLDECCTVTQEDVMRVMKDLQQLVAEGKKEALV